MSCIPKIFVAVVVLVAFSAVADAQVPAHRQNPFITDYIKRFFDEKMLSRQRVGRRLQ